MKIHNPFSDLTKFELILWLCSAAMVSVTFIISPSNDYLNLTASLIGVTALIFVAKGYVTGQVLTVIFSLFYGVISFYFRYYGEMITYLGMTAPIAVLSIFSWLKHPYSDTKEVAINKMSGKSIIFMFVFSIIVTGIFHRILLVLDTPNLIFSTVSITTSFLASYLMFMRSPYYAVAYACNDIVLIILWTLASIENDPAYLPMVACFGVFLINDVYGFISWKKMNVRQSEK